MVRALITYLFFAFSLSGKAQQLLLHASQLDTIIPLDSSWAEDGLDGFRQNSKLVGQFNNRFPATLLDSSGMVFVSKSAISEFTELMDTADIIILPSPLSLKNVIISFRLSSEDITSQIIPENREELSYTSLVSQIQTNITQVRLNKKHENQSRIAVMRYQQQNRFFLHQYLDFTEVELLAYTNDNPNGDYALLQILGESPYPNVPLINTQPTLQDAAYTINYPPRTYYHSSASALVMHRSALESSLALLEPAIGVYQSIRRLPPASLAQFHEQQSSAYQYLASSEAENKRVQSENQYLLSTSLLRLQGALNRQTREVEKLHRFYHKSQTVRRSLTLLPLSRFLSQQQGRRSNTKDRMLSFLARQEQTRNSNIEQALFKTLMSKYFEDAQADYFSRALLDQIQSHDKSFDSLGEQIYSESILAQPQRMIELLESKGSEALFQALEKDVGYIFCRQLLRDQEEKIFRPYRKALQDWTALENEWLREIAVFKQLPFLDGNNSQRYHLLESVGIAALPAWKEVSGSPLFNQQHELLGFLFPQLGGQAGVEWELPPPKSEFLFQDLRSIVKVIQQITP